jgi:hypothetical protein
MDRSNCRKLAALWALGQGLVLAAVPQVNVALLKRSLGLNFDNADQLEATTEYRRDLRTTGLGLMAAGGTALLVEELWGDGDDTDAADDETTDD